MIAQNLDGAAMNIAGTSGARVLTGVANGKENSDAVNISQLSPVVSALGGDAKLNTDGTITAPEYSINGTTVNNVGDALSQVDTAVTNINNDLATGAIGLVKQDAGTRNIMIAQNLDGAAMNIAGTSGARVLTGVANGKEDSDAVTIAQLRAVGVVDPDGKMLGAVTYDDISLASARLGGIDGTLLTNVQNGTIGANSMDAVNGGQLYTLQQHFDNRYNNMQNQVNYLSDKVENFDPGSNPGGNDNFGSVDGEHGIAVGKDSQVVGDGGTTLGHGTSVLGPDGEPVHNGTAVGENSLVSSHGGTAIGQGSNVTGEGSTAIGQNANATGNNSLALGQNSEAHRENSVSVGAVGNERQIINVADGVAPTDAVNVNQLNTSIEGVRSSIDHYRRDANGGIASAVALANLPQASLAGESMVSLAGGAYAGQAAMAFGLSTATRNGKWVIKASGSTNTRGTVAGGAGVGYRW